MKIEKIDVNKTVGNVEKLLSEDPNVSPALKSAIKLLIMLVTVLINQLGLNSSNSSKPPSTDPNRKKKKNKSSKKKPGGQIFHILKITGS